MKYLTALWHALMTFFSHLKEAHQTERAKEEQQQATREILAQRERHDEAVRGAPKSDVDKRLDSWMRD